MKNLPAFSFPDILVTMIISMVVVAASFSVFRFSYDRIFHYKSLNEDYKQLYQLYAIMQEDFNRASEISYYNNDLQMLILTKKYNYLFDDEMIIRTTEISNDTFFVDKQEVAMYFNRQEQSAGLIDEINFTLHKGGTALPYKFVKEYSAEMEMELEALN
ncbi:MAG: hypothetical protein LBR81_03555 [Prevotellaceae bacterium]|jgi:hypothetical protein|nr:hypothetical protein [Prevotellaceae bacterium]